MTDLVERPRVLIVFPWGLGNMVLFTPALAALRAHRPEARVTLVAFRSVAADVVEGGPLVDEVIVLPPTRMGKLSLLMQILGRHDVAIFAAPLPHRFGALLCRASGASVRLAFRSLADPVEVGWIERGLALHPVDFDEGRHEVYAYLDLLAPLGVSCPAPRPQLVVTEGARTRARAALRERGVTADPVAFHVGAHPTMMEKCWAADRFAQVATKVIGELGRPVVVVGGPDDREAVERMLGLCPAAVDLCGRLDVVTTAALFESCSAVVTNDSGPMHMAAAVGARVVGVFGPTSPFKNAPFGVQGRTRVVRRDLPCSPCYRIGGAVLCQPRSCLLEVTVDMVWQSLQDALADRTVVSSDLASAPWGPASPAPLGPPLPPCGPLARRG